LRLRKILLEDRAITYIILQSDSECIDRIGVHRANILDHQRAHAAIVIPPGRVLRIADGNFPLGPDIVSLPKADALVPAVSAASILAKTTLDLFMREADKDHPGYGFRAHKGYGVPAHQAALQKLGPCPIHRRSFQPVLDALRGTPVDLMRELPE
jgi:ribonuclease HII